MSVSADERPTIVRLFELVAEAMELPHGYTNLLVEYEDRRVRRWGLHDSRNGSHELHRYNERAAELLAELGWA